MKSSQMKLPKSDSCRKDIFILKVFSILTLVVFLAILSFSATAIAAGNPGPPLFAHSPFTIDQKSLGDLKAANPTIIRSRFVQINFDLLSIPDQAAGRGQEGAQNI